MSFSVPSFTYTDIESVGYWDILETVSLKEAPKDFKLRLLKALELDVDTEGIYVTKNGKAVTDPYIGKPVRFSNMAIFPGSAIVLDDNPLSIASYIEEHEEAS